jgi:hypothetical protein
MSYEPVPVSAPGIDEFVRALRALYTFGGVEIARFRADGLGQRSDWFRTSAKVFEYESFRDLLGSPAAREAFAMIQIPEPFPISSPPEFPSAGGRWTLMLDGWLASRLMHGGAFGRFTGSPVAAKALGMAAAHDLIQDRYGDFDAYLSFEAWTPWFHDIAWDATLVLADRERLEATVIVMTDTD